MPDAHQPIGTRRPQIPLAEPDAADIAPVRVVSSALPRSALSPLVVAMLLGRGLRREWALLFTVVLFAEGWILGLIPQAPFPESVRLQQQVLLLHWGFTCLLWPAIAGPVLVERIARFGQLPIPLLASWPALLLWGVVLGQLLLYLAHLCWVVPLFGAFPQMDNLLPIATLLAFRGTTMSAWWLAGRALWGWRSLRPGLWLLVGEFTGLLVILLDPNMVAIRGVGGELLRGLWTPWLLQGWLGVTDIYFPVATPLTLIAPMTWMLLHLLGCLAMLAISARLLRRTSPETVLSG